MADRHDDDALFKALADPSRRKLLDVLHAHDGQTLTELCDHLDMTRQGVTKHLQVLAEAGVVRDVKVGRERLWQLDPMQIAEARRTLEMIGQQWDAALGRLKAFVET